MASDPRDRVYAFLGLDRDRRINIQPDYQLGLNHCLQNTATDTIPGTNLLKILSYVSRASRGDLTRKFLPSWVPDFTMPPRTCCHDLSSIMDLKSSDGFFVPPAFSRKHSLLKGVTFLGRTQLMADGAVIKTYTHEEWQHDITGGEQDFKVEEVREAYASKNFIKRKLCMLKGCESPLMMWEYPNGVHTITRVYYSLGKSWIPRCLYRQLDWSKDGERFVIE